MPGPQVKNWPMYHKLRQQGKSKMSAARITNASAKGTTSLQRAARRRMRSGY